MKIPKIIGLEFVEWKSGFGFRPVLDPDSFNCRAVGLCRIRREVLKEFNPYWGKRQSYVITHWFARTRHSYWYLDFEEVLDPRTTKRDARAKYRNRVKLWESGDLQQLSACVEPAVRVIVFPEKDVPGQDVFKARLEVIKDAAPSVVNLFRKSLDVKDLRARELLQRELVQAYFVDVATSLTDEEFTAWPENNPLDKKWIAVLAENLRSPERLLDTVNYDLALNWIKLAYNKLEPKNLAEVVYQATGKRLTAVAIRKRHYRKLGLMTERKAGARAKKEN